MAGNPDELVRKAHNKLNPGFFGKFLSSKEYKINYKKINKIIPLYKLFFSCAY